VGAPIHSQSPVLVAALPILSPPLAGSSTGPSPRDTKGLAPVAVEAPILFPSPALTAAPPTLARLRTDWPPSSLNPVLAAAISSTLDPPLAGSSTGASPGAPKWMAPSAVGTPILPQIPVVAAALPILSPPLAGSSTGPSPGAPEGVAPVAVAPINFPSPALTAAPPTLARLPTDWPTYSLNPVLAAAISPTLAPPLSASSTGASLGPLRVWPLRLWEPLFTPRAHSWQQLFPA